MTPPSDDPGALVVAAAIVLAVTVLFFAYWVLGGSRRFVADERAVRPTIYLALTMVVALGLAGLARWHDGNQREAAWDQYDQWLEQQE